MPIHKYSGVFMRPTFLVTSSCLLLSCGGAARQATVQHGVPSTGDKDRVEPSAEAKLSPEAKSVDCSDHWPTDVPDWKIVPGAPVAEADSLTGLWVKVLEDVPGLKLPPAKSGPVEWVLGCARGYEVMLLRVDGDRVVVKWAYKEPASGVMRPDWYEEAGRAEGSLHDGTVRLEGAHVRVHGWTDRPETKVKCLPVQYELELDPDSGHLIGTRNNQPLRLAPLVVRARTASCGDPPP